MDTNELPPSQDCVDSKTTFRRPSNDLANRKYRRRSPVNGSSSSDGSPEQNRRSSPVHSKENCGKFSEPHKGRKDGQRDLDKESGRAHYGRSSDSYRNDRYSSRSTYHHSKREDCSRHERDAHENDKRYRGGHHSEHKRPESDHNRSRDHSDRYSVDKYGGSGHRSRDKEKYEDLSSDKAGSGRRQVESRTEETERDLHGWDRDRLDEKRDSRRSSGDRRSDRTHSRDEKRKYEDGETKKDKDAPFKPPRDRCEDKIVLGSKDHESPGKKIKQLSVEKFTDGKNEAEKQPSSSSSAPQAGDKVIPGEKHSNGTGISSDIDAARVAAMKAAEMVNKNLVGTGYLTADQKKKLLWGNKKSTAAEESAHMWDSALIGDRERQEKFNKLMGVKGNTKLEQKPDNQEMMAEKQKELQMDLEKQYTAGLRRRDGRTVGLGL